MPTVPPSNGLSVLPFHLSVPPGWRLAALKPVAHHPGRCSLMASSSSSPCSPVGGRREEWRCNGQADRIDHSQQSPVLIDPSFGDQEPVVLAMVSLAVRDGIACSTRCRDAASIGQSSADPAPDATGNACRVPSPSPGVAPPRAYFGLGCPSRFLPVRRDSGTTLRPAYAATGTPCTGTSAYVFGAPDDAPLRVVHSPGTPLRGLSTML